MDKLDFMDILNIVSSNLDQNTMQQLLEQAVKDIHNHLEEQDKKLDKILEVINNEKNKRSS